jgi:hypothetical protein
VKSSVSSISFSTERPLHSEAIPGFEIPVRALFDEEVNLKALRTILAGS